MGIIPSEGLFLFKNYFEFLERNGIIWCVSAGLFHSEDLKGLSTILSLSMRGKEAGCLIANVREGLDFTECLLVCAIKVIC